MPFEKVVAWPHVGDGFHRSEGGRGTGCALNDPLRTYGRRWRHIAGYQSAPRASEHRDALVSEASPLRVMLKGAVIIYGGHP